MRINTNLTAMNTYGQYTKNNNKISSAVEKLSSGYAINSAADNAAGLAISEKMRAQIRGLEKSSANAQDAISLIQTAEGALNESTEILQRMRELAVQSSSDTNNDDIDRTALQDEFSQLQKELNDISSNTAFNKKNLLDGSLSTTTKDVSISNLANAKTAVSVGDAAAGNYSFTISTKVESSAVTGQDATGTASLGSTAKTKIDTATVTMGTKAGETALYNGDYTLSATVDASSGSITVNATGSNGQNFSATLDKAAIDDATSLSLNFETSTGASDSFTLSLSLSSATDADSSNALETLASAIKDVTVSVDGGVDAQDATYGVYANVTGGTSVKLNSGDTSVSFDNGVTVSFDSMSATDVAVETSAAAVLDATEVAGTIVAGGAAAYSSVEFDLSGTFGSLADGDSFAVQLGDKTYEGTFKDSIQSSLATALAGSDALVADDNGGSYTMSVSGTGVVTYTSDKLGATTTHSLDGGTTQTATLDSVASSEATLTPIATGAAGYVLGTATTAASFATAAITTGSTGSEDWINVSQGDTVYFQLGDDVYKGTYDTDVDTTLVNMLNGASYTDSNGVEYTFSGVSATHAATFKANTVGVTANPGDITYQAGTAATGEKATLSDGLVSKLGTTADKGTASTTATKFTVEDNANSGLTFQVGANEGDEMAININNMDCQSLGVSSARINTQDTASAAINAVDKAINTVSAQRAYLGAIQNRLDHKIANLNTSTENLTAAEGQIRNVDMAKQMTEFTNANILQQAATAMLAQANSLPQNVLSLIGG